MKKFKLQKIVPYMLISSMLLTCCGKKSDCTLPTRHVHLYTKEITSDITISKYSDSEYEKNSGYSWQDEYLEITKIDEELYQLLDRNGLFNGLDNWNYLYYEMSNNHDYLKFYYEYDTIETYTTTDEKGHTETHTRTVHHDGWHTNPNDSDNTGKTRLYHHKYYAYRVIYENGEFKLDRSPYVDDIREVLSEYPYVPENGSHEVYEQFKFNRSELKYLTPEQFTTFNHPDLSNTTPNLGPILKK
mgnify:CR=1 FL=1